MAPRHGYSEDFSHAITDLMTSIAIVFILLFLFFAQQQQKETEDKVSETERFVTDLLEDLQKKLGSFEIDVLQKKGDPLTLEVTLPEHYQGSLTFRQNKSALLKAGENLLDGIVPELLKVVCSSKFKEGMDSIVVEGHASTEGSERRNVRLSTERATETLLYSLNGKLGSDHRMCFQDLAAASGRGAWHPKLFEGGEDREASRRVVFRIRVKSFEQRFREEPARDNGASDLVQPLEAGVLGVAG